ncbi:hypothetical protein EVAR_59979_1 [Eumeta japonica]|uniref:SAM domain-containing protein n=1 Tax=Eumeta variegata TaxID=151549 RepID=A0A4C2AAG8_EUMVA|nr:hypothetical protein EVAR_59979_1 [Eumeta japonica]
MADLQGRDMRTDGMNKIIRIPFSTSGCGTPKNKFRLGHETWACTLKAFTTDRKPTSGTDGLTCSPRTKIKDINMLQLLSQEDIKELIPILGHRVKLIAGIKQLKQIIDKAFPTEEQESDSRLLSLSSLLSTSSLHTSESSSLSAESSWESPRMIFSTSRGVAFPKTMLVSESHRILASHYSPLN